MSPAEQAHRGLDNLAVGAWARGSSPGRPSPLIRSTSVPIVAGLTNGYCRSRLLRSCLSGLVHTTGRTALILTDVTFCHATWTIRDHIKKSTPADRRGSNRTLRGDDRGVLAHPEQARRLAGAQEVDAAEVKSWNRRAGSVVSDWEPMESNAGNRIQRAWSGAKTRIRLGRRQTVRGARRRRRAADQIADCLQRPVVQVVAAVLCLCSGCGLDVQQPGRRRGQCVDRSCETRWSGSARSRCLARQGGARPQARTSRPDWHDSSAIWHRSSRCQRRGPFQGSTAGLW